MTRILGINNILRLILILLLASCVAGEGSKRKVECGVGQVFDSATRNCIGAQVSDGPPTPTLEQISVAEDSGTNQVILTYSEPFNEIATDCSIVSSGVGIAPVTCSCVGGVCVALVTPDADFFGIAEFVYNVTDLDGTSFNKLVSVTVSPVNDVPTDLNSGVSGVLSLNEDLNVVGADFPTSIGKNLGTDFIDSEDGTNICYQVVTQPDHGTVTFNLDCTMNYTHEANYYGTDSFTYRLVDTEGGVSDAYTVNVSVAADAGDAPVGTLTSIADFNEDDYANGGTAISLTWSDPDNIPSVFDEPDTCSITATSNVYVVGSCSCSGADAAATCTATIRALPNKVGSAYFKYTLTDTTDGKTSTEQTVSFNILSQDDDALLVTTATGDVDGTYSIPNAAESATSVAASMSFTIDAPFHPDSSSLTYSVLTDPANGILSNCLGKDGSLTTDLSCDYLPNDGNLTGLGVHANANSGDGNIKFSSRIPGSFGNDITIELINVANLGNGNEVAWLENNKDIKVHMESGVSIVNNVIAAINANNETKGLIVPTVVTLGSNTVASGASFRLDSGTAGSASMDSFVMRVTDFDGDISDIEVPITITPTDDKPVVCEYSTFEDASECGLAGCIGTESPSGRITVPTGKTYHFYDKTSGTCWQGTDAGWSAVEFNISDHSVNEGNIITIDRIVMDEGGGDSAEDSQRVMINSITSSNPVLIPVANVRLKVGGTVMANGLTLPMPALLGSAASSDDTLGLEIEVERQGNNTGVSTITLVFCDSNDGVTCSNVSSSMSFDVSINNISVAHGGWTNIGGVGAKIDKYGKVPGEDSFCPYSRTLCESGLPCSGTTSPVGNGIADPDDINAIYFDSSAQSCYRIDDNALATTIQGLKFVSRVPGGASIELVDDAAITAGNEVVTVSGSDVSVKVDGGVTTIENLISALRASNSAMKYIKVWPVESGQTTLGVTAIGSTATVSNANVNYTDLGGGSTIELADSAAINAGGEIVSVSGSAVKVFIDSGNTTGSQIARAINTDVLAKSEIEVSLSFPATVTTNAKTTLTGFSNANWTAFSTKDISSDDRVFCDITPYEYDNGCYGVGSTCSGYGNPYKMLLNVTEIDSRYWDSKDNVCYKSIDKDKDGTVDGWDRYFAPSSVTLQWNDFTVSTGGSISSYNVYRRLANASFDYHRPINIDPVSVTVKKFVDTAGTSWIPPTPGTVYHYEVRPVVNSLPTDSSESFKKVRVLSPPENKVFVHRWMVNKSICGMMNKTTDAVNNFRCSYEGPGDSRLAAGSNYYDIGADYLVDTYEAGCPYTGHSEARPCSTSGGTCLGVQDPGVAGITAQAADGNSFNHAIFYNRDNGKCWQTTNGTSWTEVNGSSTFPYAISTPGLPPLTNISQEQAEVSCTAMPSYSTGSMTGITAAATLDHHLPSRKEQIAYSLWDSDSLTDTSISTLETGLSLNSSSKCNSSSASGIDSGYADVDIPNNSAAYSLPGTASSGIRSMITGSEETKECVSRFGVQDHVGNVAEWSFSRVNCSPSNYSCTGVSSNSFAGNRFSVANYPDDFEAGQMLDAGGSGYQIFKLDGAKGPCVDSNSDGTCDTFLDSWTIDLENNSAGRFFIPMGLPVHVDFNISNFSTSVVAPYAVEIGPTSGITANQLHDDLIKTQTQYIYSEDNNCGGMAAGGDYAEGVGSGVWNFRFMPCSEPANGYLLISDVMFKGVAGGATLTLNDPAAPSSAISVGVVGSAVSVSLETDANSNIISTAADIAAAINGDVGASALINAYIVGTSSDTIVSPLSTTTINGATSTTLSKNQKVGFRCVIPVQNSEYQD